MEPGSWLLLSHYRSVNASIPLLIAFNERRSYGIFVDKPCRLHNDKITGLPRIAGFKKALKDQGLMMDSKQIFFGDFSFESGQQGLEALLQAMPELTAIFAAKDDMAASVLSQAFKKGIKISEQLSVIGYDNTQLARMMTPSLTTLAQPLYEMGRQGMEILIQHIDKGRSMKSVILPHTIVERETVRKLEINQIQ